MNDGCVIMVHIIDDKCIGVKSGECVDVCPVDCIHDAGDQFIISPEECIDCHACESVCPVNAIICSDDSEDRLEAGKIWADKNRDRAREMGV